MQNPEINRKLETVRQLVTIPVLPGGMFLGLLTGGWITGAYPGWGRYLLLAWGIIAALLIASSCLYWLKKN